MCVSPQAASHTGSELQLRSPATHPASCNRRRGSLAGSPWQPRYRGPRRRTMQGIVGLRDLLGPRPGAIRKPDTPGANLSRRPARPLLLLPSVFSFSLFLRGGCVSVVSHFLSRGGKSKGKSFCVFLPPMTSLFSSASWLKNWADEQIQVVRTKHLGGLLLS